MGVVPKKSGYKYFRGIERELPQIARNSTTTKASMVLGTVLGSYHKVGGHNMNMLFQYRMMQASSLAPHQGNKKP